jgi:methionyl aminopeptidase
VKDTSQVEILSLEQPRNVRMKQARDIVTYVQENFLTLPFAERWLGKRFPSKLVRGAALKELMNAGVLHPYPVLREANKGLVSQAEFTFLVEKDGARILTKP